GAEAVEAACAALGEWLPGSSPRRAGYPEELDAAAERAGISRGAFGFTRLLLNRGLVIPAPDPRQVEVAAGFLTAQEVRRAARAVGPRRGARPRRAGRGGLGGGPGGLAGGAARARGPGPVCP